MDDREFSIQGRKKGGKSGLQDRSLETFHQACSRYEGTPEEFGRKHAKLYRKEEGLRADGTHPLGKEKFPNETLRSKQYNQYSQSTRARDNARRAYDDRHGSAQREFDRMTAEEQIYYSNHTSGLVPDQHEALERRAKELKDKAYNNATKREDFLRTHPYGYHNSEQQDEHYGFAERAYTEHERAKGLQSHHQEYRAYQTDERRDKYGRRVADRRFPYELSP